MKALNFEKVIPYDSDGLQNIHQQFDFIFDAVGKYTKKDCYKWLAKGGIFKTVGGLEVADESVEKLVLLKKLAESKALIPVIDKVFSMEAIKEAHQYVDSGRKKGNVVIVMGS